MPLSVRDNFNRADGNLVAPWTLVVGGTFPLAIAANEVQSADNTVDHNRAYYYSGLTVPAAQYAQIRITARVHSTAGSLDPQFWLNEQGVILRRTGANYYDFGIAYRRGPAFGPEDFYALAFIDYYGPTRTDLGSVILGPYATAVPINSVLRGEADGDQLRMYLNDVLLLTRTHATLASGDVGLYMWRAVPSAQALSLLRIDDFEAGQLPYEAIISTSGGGSMGTRVYSQEMSGPPKRTLNAQQTAHGAAPTYATLDAIAYAAKSDNVIVDIKVTGTPVGTLTLRAWYENGTLVEFVKPNGSATIDYTAATTERRRIDAYGGGKIAIAVESIGTWTFAAGQGVTVTFKDE